MQDIESEEGVGIAIFVLKTLPNQPWEVKPSQSVQPNTFHLSGGQNPSLLILSFIIFLEKNESFTRL